MVYFRCYSDREVPSKVTNEYALPGELLTPAEFYCNFGQPFRYSHLFRLVDISKKDIHMQNQHRFYDPKRDQMED